MEGNESRDSFLDFVPSFCFARTSHFKIKIMIGPLEDWEKLMSSPVAILGGGVSGRGVIALLQRLGCKFRVYDELGIRLTPAKLRSSALVVVSPGFRPDHPWLLLARQMKIRVLGELDFASCFTASPITAITGTNGKTTIATLLHHALSKLGHVTSTAGNIGLPLSQFVAEQLNVKSRILLEISSFQSRNISYLTPDRGIWTNFAEDHLDYHGTMKDYFLSKLSLLQKCQGEKFVGKSVLTWANRLSLDLPDNVQVISPSRQSSPSFDKEHFLSSYPQRENYALASGYASSLGISEEEFSWPAKIINLNHIDLPKFIKLMTLVFGTIRKLRILMRLSLHARACVIPSSGSEEAVQRSKDGWIFPRIDPIHFQSLCIWRGRGRNDCKNQCF